MDSCLDSNLLLPFYPDTSYEYEKYKSRKGEEAALEQIKRLWEGDEYSPFYEAKDIYIQTSLKNSANSDFICADFFSQSSRFMSVLLGHLEELK